MRRPVLPPKPGTGSFRWKKRAFFGVLGGLGLLLVSLLVLLSGSINRRFRVALGDTDEGFLIDYAVDSRVPLLKTAETSPGSTKVVIFAAGKGAGQRLIRDAVKEVCKRKGAGSCRPLCDVLDADVFNTCKYLLHLWINQYMYLCICST